MSTSSDGPADPAGSTGPTGAAPSDTTPLPPPPVASSPALPSVEPSSPSASPPASPPSVEPPPQPSLTPSPDASGNGPSDPSRANDTPASSIPVGARNGDLTPRWRYVLAAAWVIAFFAYAAIWQASVQIGIGTWWIGPRAHQTHTVVRVLPSLLTISMAMCAIYNVPRLIRLSAMGVLLATILAIPDLSRSIGLGVAELVIAGLLGLVTAAALSGRYRLAPDPSGGDVNSSAAPNSAAHDRSGDTAHMPHNGALDGPANRTPDGTLDRTPGPTLDGAASGANGSAGGSAADEAAMALFAPPDQTGS